MPQIRTFCFSETPNLFEIIMYENPFIHQNNTEYTRDFNVVKKYINDTAYFLHKMKNKDLGECKEIVKKIISSSGKSPLKDPKILMLERGANGDKDQKESTLLTFLENTQTESDTCSPTMTTYLHPDKKTSVIAKFLSENMAKRKEVKKRGHVAEMNGDKVLESYCYNLQTAIKIINNSVSGAHGSAGTPLFNHSAHPTLTSTCRCATSYANANNERFLEGMRHYWSYEVAQADIISIVANTDLGAMEKIIEKYQLELPTAEDLIKKINRSVNLYWKNQENVEKLSTLIRTLTPVERATYYYTQDCHSLYELNPTLVSNMMLDFITFDDTPIDDPERWIALLDDDILMTVSIIASDILNGRTLTMLKEKDYVGYAKFGAVVKNFIESRDRYADLIRTLWRTEHMPASIAVYPSAIRRTVIVSDTDSTIYTVANWVERICGKLTFDNSGRAIAAMMVYLSSQTLKHILANYSANMGVVPERIFQLTMKNEFMMETLMLTSKSKHYAYRVIAKEGNVYSNPKLKLKGKDLRNSKVPEQLRKDLKTMINDILEDTRTVGEVSILKYLNRVGDLEREILNKIKHGSSEYLTRVKLRGKDSYRKPMSSNYFYYELWENVFAYKYGNITTVPVGTVKATLKFANKTQFNLWIEELEDIEFKNKLKNFLSITGRGYLTTILVPIELAMRDGLPKEVLSAMDIRKVIYESVEGFYLTLESLGYYCKNDERSRLIMDNY